MTDQFIGEVRLFAGNFAPTGWAFCDGQVMSIAQNTALFSLLGTNYGGDGKSTFALPDLRDRVPLHSGQGPSLSQRDVGASGGTDQVSLVAAQLPTHAHPAASRQGTTTVATGGVPASHGRYASVPDTVTDGLPHNNRPPFLGISYIIALQGIFPSRS
jgi:microcystin-dependent protein